MCPWGQTSVIDLHSSSPAPLRSTSPRTKDLICLKGQKGHPRVCGQHGTSHSEPQHPPCPCPAPPSVTCGWSWQDRGSAGSWLPGLSTWQAPALGGACSFCQVLALAELGEPGMEVAGVQTPGTYCPLFWNANWELGLSPSLDILPCSNTAEHLPPQCSMWDGGRGGQDAGQGVRDKMQVIPQKDRNLARSSTQPGEAQAWMSPHPRGQMGHG